MQYVEEKTITMNLVINKATHALQLEKKSLIE